MHWAYISKKQKQTSTRVISKINIKMFPYLLICTSGNGSVKCYKLSTNKHGFLLLPHLDFQ